MNIIQHQRLSTWTNGWIHQYQSLPNWRNHKYYLVYQVVDMQPIKTTWMVSLGKKNQSTQIKFNCIDAKWVQILSIPYCLQILSQTMIKLSKHQKRDAQLHEDIFSWNNWIIWSIFIGFIWRSSKYPFESNNDRDYCRNCRKIFSLLDYIIG